MSSERGDSPQAGRRPSLTTLGASGSNPVGPRLPAFTEIDSPAANKKPKANSVSSGSASTGPAGSGPDSNTYATPLNSSTSEQRSSTSFWLDLKGVESWFDSLEPAERVTLISSLLTRSSESQLRQYESIIRQTTQTFYHAPVTSVHSVNSVISRQRNVGNAPVSRLNALSAGNSSPTNTYLSAYDHDMQEELFSGKSVNNNTSPPKERDRYPRTSSPLSVPHSAPAPAPAPGTQNGQPFPSLMNPTPLSQFKASANDLYTQAFLPLPRSANYSPWLDPLRPQSAEVWSESLLGSPTIQTVHHELPTVKSEQMLSSSTPNSRSMGIPMQPWRAPLAQPMHMSPVTAKAGLKDIREKDLENERDKESQKYKQPKAQAQQAPFGPSQSIRPTMQLSPQSLKSSLSSIHINETTTTTDQAMYAFSKPLKPYRQSNSPIGQVPDKDKEKRGPISAHNNQRPQTAPTSRDNSQHPSRESSPGPVPPKETRSKRSMYIDIELLSDIGAWLRSCRLHKYTGNLSGMTWQEVILLDNHDLELRGVNALGARRKLLKMFEEVREACESGLLPENSNGADCAHNNPDHK